MARKARESTAVTQRFSEILRERTSAYAKQGITQREIAEGIGITPSQLSDYLNDKKSPTYDVFGNICRYFGMSSDYVLNIHGDYLDEIKKTVQAFTGLTEDAINVLAACKTRDALMLDIFEHLILWADKGDPSSYMYSLHKAAEEALSKAITPDIRKWSEYTETDYVAGFPDAYIRLLTERYLRDSVEQYSKMIEAIISQTWDEKVLAATSKESEG